MTLGNRHLSKYGSYKSRHDFTQAQLMTCLILRAYLKTTYRGVIEQLELAPALRQAMGIQGKLPHYSTLKKFADKSGVAAVLEGMLGELAKAVQAQEAGEGFTAAAMDSTGMETTSASAHFTSRAGRARSRFIKLSVVVICGALVPAAMAVSWGPANDKVEARELLPKAAATIQPDTLYADAGYDAEWIHEYCHEQWPGGGVSSIIKPARHAADGSLGGDYRSAMTPGTLKRCGYGMRWHVESFMSALKRTMGSTLLARSTSAMFTEVRLRVLAYALRR
jgi:hypothetical protein